MSKIVIELKEGLSTLAIIRMTEAIKKEHTSKVETIAWMVD